MAITQEQYAKLRDSRWPVGQHQGIRVRELGRTYLEWMARTGHTKFNYLAQVAEFELTYRQQHPEEISCGDFDLWPADYSGPGTRHADREQPDPTELQKAFDQPRGRRSIDDVVLAKRFNIRG